MYNTGMSKKTTVREDEERKRQERIKKRQAQLEKHLVVCPHCGEKVLDHMTKCPKCGGVLVPRGYTPMDPKKEKMFKTIGWVLGLLGVLAVILLAIFLN